MRKDLATTRLGTRSNNGYKRLWVEDVAQRLTRNSFVVGSAFEATRRLGPGLNIRPALIGGLHVSQRRGTALLSLENPSVESALPCDDVLVRISVGLITVTPSIRVFSTRKVSSARWTLSPAGVVIDGTLVPVTFGMALPSARPAILDAEITDSNLIGATEFIARLKPATVNLNATGLAALTASQFLLACGWVATGENTFQL